MVTSQVIRVLVIDDEILNNELTQFQVQTLGYQVAGAAFDGVAALQLAEATQPDVILMDLHMWDPVTQQDDPLAGLKAAEKIQQHRPTPIVLLTAHESPELTRQAGQVGVGAYLVKPASNAELHRAISISLARFQDLTEVRRLNHELQIQNADLEAFASTVAHSIQQRIGLCTGYAEFLEMNLAELTQDKIEEYLQELVHTGHALSEVVKELLFFARVRRSEKPELLPLDTPQIIRTVQERLKPLAQTRQATFALPPHWPTALGHTPWVEEIWMNYLSNGIKYGGNPPQLTLGAAPQKDGWVRFWVRDNGQGLSAAEQALLFQPFTRLNPEMAEGYGLGLVIVQRMAEKLGGQVGVESRPGQGCTFYFTLPGLAG